MTWPPPPPHLVDPYPWSRLDGRLAHLPRDVVDCIIRPMVLYSNRWQRLASSLQTIDGRMQQFVTTPSGIAFLISANSTPSQPIVLNENVSNAHYLGQFGANYIFQIQTKIVALDHSFEHRRTITTVPDLQPREARLVGSTVVAAGRVICQFFLQLRDKKHENQPL